MVLILAMLIDFACHDCVRKSRLDLIREIKDYEVRCTKRRRMRRIGKKWEGSDGVCAFSYVLTEKPEYLRRKNHLYQNAYLSLK